MGIIFGGRSGEHEVSIRSAASLIQAIDTRKYDVVPIGITQSGKWLAPAEAFQLLPGFAQKRLPSSFTSTAKDDIAIPGDPSQHALLAYDARQGSIGTHKFDVVFPVLHGPFGEDGTIQGLLEMADIPYVGGGVLASACGMDKVTMKALFAQAGLPLCKYTWFLRSEWRSNPAEVLRKVAKQIGFPCFVKPANLGSSVGVSRADDRKSLEKAIKLADRYDRKIVVEEAVDAREIECAVIGNYDARASLPGEYVIKHESARFLDYTEKYSSTGHVEFVVPAPVSKAVRTEIQKLAIKAFQSIDGAGLARVDFFMERKSKRLLVNELNTMPGLTDVSGYPKMWEASGLSYTKMIDELIQLALKRHDEKSKNAVSRE